MKSRSPSRWVLGPSCTVWYPHTMLRCLVRFHQQGNIPHLFSHFYVQLLASWWTRKCTRYEHALRRRLNDTWHNWQGKLLRRAVGLFPGCGCCHSRQGTCRPWRHTVFINHIVPELWQLQKHLDNIHPIHFIWINNFDSFEKTIIKHVCCSIEMRNDLQWITHNGPTVLWRKSFLRVIFISIRDQMGRKEITFLKVTYKIT